MRERADAAVVERLIAGDRPAHVHPSELHLAIVALDGRGMSATEIAERVGCTPRQVARHRKIQHEAEATA